MNRVFRVEGGTLAEQIATITADRERIGLLYTALGEALGCEQIHTWPWTGRFAGCTFAKGKEPGLADWRLSHHMWVPRRKTVLGKAIWATASILEPLPAIQTVLEQYGLTVHKPQLDSFPASGPSYVEGFGHKGIYFVTVPWYEPTALDKAMACQLDMDADFTFVTSWKQPDDWVEISHFQKINEWLELDGK